MRSRNQATNLSVSLPSSLPSVSVVGQVVCSLCQAKAHGSVVMRFERSAYLQFKKQLVCFGLNEIGASSITGLFDHTVHALPPSLIVGATAQLSTEYLLIDDRFYYDLRGATSYVSLLQDKVSSFAVPTKQFELLAKLTLPSAGFAPLLRQVTAAAGEADLASAIDASSIESELLSFSMPSIEYLLFQLSGSVASGIAGNIRSQFDPALFQNLVGAGPGLTPSGDDFLCGVFTALHIAGFPDVAKSLWSCVRRVAEQSTTQVSAALLEQSALGESGERIDDVIKAYYDYPTTAAIEFQRRVELIGETSGWDWLTGFVLCGDIQSRNQIRMPASFDLNYKSQATDI